MTKFKMIENRWYGWQMLPGYSGSRYVPYFSPIYVTMITPLKTGKSFLEIEFFNAFYADGVKGFSLKMRSLKRGTDYLIAELIYDGDVGTERSAIINELEFGWLETCCPSLFEHYPLNRMPAGCSSSPQQYLNHIYNMSKDDVES